MSDPVNRISLRALMKFRVRAFLQTALVSSSSRELIMLPWSFLFRPRHREKLFDTLHSCSPGRLNLLIFAHYATGSVVDECVIFYLAQLKNAGFDIVFCSTAPSLSHESVGKLQQVCMRIITRKNVGYDFGSYYIGWQSLSHIDRAGYRIIAFANDSVYGPVGSLDQFCGFIENTSYDMCGAVDSFEHMYHIPSWFLVFKNNDRVNRYLTWFWRRFKFYNHRAIVISFYEIGMTQLAIEHGLKVGAFAPYSRVRRAAEVRMEELGYISHTLCRAVNPTQYYWRILVEDFAVPFVKRELLSINPRNIPDLCKIEELAATRGFDINMIEQRGWRNRTRL